MSLLTFSNTLTHNAFRVLLFSYSLLTLNYQLLIIKLLLHSSSPEIRFTLFRKNLNKDKFRLKLKKLTFYHNKTPHIFVFNTKSIQSSTFKLLTHPPSQFLTLPPSAYGTNITPTTLSTKHSCSGKDTSVCPHISPATVHQLSVSIACNLEVEI